MDMGVLEKRINRLEDVEAIKQLKSRYCHLYDDTHNLDHIAGDFAEGGIWESADFGKAQGHKDIRELFSGFRKLLTLSHPNITNPVIEDNGDRATGIWYIMGPWTLTENDKKILMAARYDDDYVKIDGAWNYQHLRTDLRMNIDR